MQTFRYQFISLSARSFQVLNCQPINSGFRYRSLITSRLDLIIADFYSLTHGECSHTATPHNLGWIVTLAQPLLLIAINDRYWFNYRYIALDYLAVANV